MVSDPAAPAGRPLMTHARSRRCAALNSLFMPAMSPMRHSTLVLPVSSDEADNAARMPPGVAVTGMALL